jgi:lipopolysaccharide export LptBFGC system permease protein LptF
LKAAGKSPKQILLPFFSFAAFIAGIWLFAVHPAGLFWEAKYNENVGVSSKNNCGVWIDCPQSDRVIFIKTVDGDKMEVVSVFNLKDNGRIFARRAAIEKDAWNLENVAIVENDGIRSADAMKIPGVVSLELTKLLSNAPQKQDVYSLYKVYKIRARDRAILRLYELELHKLLANCFSFLLFALIAAVVCFPINRYKTKTGIAIKVISAAAFLKFANGMLESLAYSEAVPAAFALWAVPLMLTCVSVAALIWREA